MTKSDTQLLDHDEPRELRRVLVGGLVVSASLMASGIVWALASRSAAPSWTMGTASPGPSALAGAGVVALALTPCVRVARIAWMYFRRGDRRYGGAAVAVALVLAIAFVAGLTR